MFGSGRLVNPDLDLSSGSSNLRMGKLQVTASSKVENKDEPERDQRHTGTEGLAREVSRTKTGCTFSR
jgi:hypothetical protein